MRSSDGGLCLKTKKKTRPGILEVRAARDADTTIPNQFTLDPAPRRLEFGALLLAFLSDLLEGPVKLQSLNLVFHKMFLYPHYFKSHVPYYHLIE